MMRILVLELLFLALLHGCDEAKGDSPPSCGSSGQLAWVDASGQCVPGVVVISYFRERHVEYIDDGGLAWDLNTVTGEVQPEGRREFWFESTDCTGTAYVTGSPPRLTFRAVGDDTIRVMPDNAQSLDDVDTHSRIGFSNPDCVENSTADEFLLPMIPAELTVPDVPVEIPTLPYVFPIHPELPR